MTFDDWAAKRRSCKSSMVNGYATQSAEAERNHDKPRVQPADRKLSKIETLRLASSYIAHLGTQLVAGPMDQPCLKHNLPTPGYDSTNPRPVCTFCLASMKKMQKSLDGFCYREASQPSNIDPSRLVF
ncbi:hypothetical protein DAPPUDRAFT_259955 [Daphnia pulex]|uniref:BHLH domain-containing protein n=1 Tax=Daphnia pulex TaxID=6669 RepID=E9HI71_DAPPU|nr:hypothetical protein DAPPUDRAFT_259955 [Daphnia pulex]|eukprot:EFX68562.1 hypothetical protein DAPPUDRAFT_259955 [Daphnia pulex]